MEEPELFAVDDLRAFARTVPQVLKGPGDPTHGHRESREVCKSDVGQSVELCLRRRLGCAPR
jgi:hypothetical protein